MLETFADFFIASASKYETEAKWVGHHPNSLELQKVPVEEFSQTFDYGLKDITNLDDCNQVIDWENSSFYQATNQSSSIIS